MIIKDVTLTASLIKYSWVQTAEFWHSCLSWHNFEHNRYLLESGIMLGISGIWSNYKAVTVRTLCTIELNTLTILLAYVGVSGPYWM